MLLYKRLRQYVCPLVKNLGCRRERYLQVKWVTMIRRLGFDKVFDTDFTADLTIMEEGTELIGRITNNGVLPMITSCSPGWSQLYREISIRSFYRIFPLVNHLSRCLVQWQKHIMLREWD